VYVITTEGKQLGVPSSWLTTDDLQIKRPNGSEVSLRIGVFVFIRHNQIT
jgi:hypothetical protein